MLKIIKISNNTHDPPTCAPITFIKKEDTIIPKKI